MEQEHLRILLVGNGGREHCLCWKLDQSPLVDSIFVVPGNGGTSLVQKAENVHHVQPDDFPGLVAFAKEKNINLAVIGPEAPLVAGIEGFFRAGEGFYSDRFADADASSWDTMLWTYQGNHLLLVTVFFTFFSLSNRLLRGWRVRKLLQKTSWRGITYLQVRSFWAIPAKVWSRLSQKSIFGSTRPSG